VRGSNVRINARGNGFVVSSEGQAMDNGAPGAMVQVRTANGQVVSGVVRNAGLVEIQL
jgi:flagella basal body P-ring formation protein FlgA